MLALPEFGNARMIGDDHSKKKVGGQILDSTNTEGQGKRRHDKARK